MPFTAAALVTAGIGAYKLIKGASDSADAKKRAKYNIRPSYDISPEYFQNQGIASSLAQGGLPDSSKNFYETNAERGLGSSLGASLQTGGGVNSIGNLYDQFDQNNRAIASQDAQMKIDNIKNLMGANNALADQKTQKWVLDKYQPYLDTAKSIAGEKAQGASEVNSGLNTISGAVSSFAGANAKQEDTVQNGVKQYGDASTAFLNPELSGVSEGVQAPTVNTPASLPNYQYQLPSIQPSNPSAMNLAVPDSYDQLNNFNSASRSTAISGILNKYQNSPYYSGLNNYLQTAA